MTRRWPMALAVPLLVAGCGGAADPVRRLADPAVHDASLGDAGEAGPLARALAQRLTVWTKHDGTPVYARHCRNGPVPCGERIATLASLLQQTARAHRIDPYLFAAIAVRESALDPSAVGAAGEAGIVQLHPRGVGRGVRYVHDPGYRAGCQSRPDACQRPVLEHGASALQRSIARCGSVAGGIGRYASGRCDADHRYVDRILDERRRLRSMAR